MTVGDRIRALMAEAGVILDHLDDHELGVRLASMPTRAADDRGAAATWLLYGTLDGPRDKVRA